MLILNRPHPRSEREIFSISRGMRGSEVTSVKKITDAADYCRSSTEEQLTDHQKDEYINRMKNIQQSLLEVKSQLSKQPPTISIKSDVKIIYGHFRDIIELLADCLIIIRNTKRHTVDFSRSTPTKRKLAYLKDKQKWPYFIPLKWPNHRGTVFRSIVDGQTYFIEEDGNIALPYRVEFQGKEKGHLTLNDLETLYDKSHGALHPPPPFSKGIDHDEYMRSSRLWYSKIEELISLHALITETDEEKDRRIYIYLHKSDMDGQSHFYVCEPQQPGTDWSYIPGPQGRAAPKGISQSP